MAISRMPGVWSTMILSAMPMLGMPWASSIAHGVPYPSHVGQDLGR